jgi:tRNA pseudouridine38-40 synthase
MKRYFFELSYNGTSFFGWQRQPKQISVQQEIEEALSKIHSNSPFGVVGCGRTDAGVHAHQYFLHVDLPEIIDPKQFIFKLNRMLPDSISIHAIEEVECDLHARFNAKARTYRYFIHQKKNAFLNEFSWHHPADLDFQKMNEAATVLLGTQDFTSFSKLHTDVKTNICTVSEAKWVQKGENEWYFEITADRFLRNMVRATVGTLLEVGVGKMDIEGFRKVLDSKDRGAAAVSVPAKGLFLWQIEY